MHKVLVVVAHRDDETIGAGGLIAMRARFGSEIRAISMTDGVSSRSDEIDEAAIYLRRRNSEVAAEILGFTWGNCGGFPDNQMDTVPLLEVVKFVESESRSFDPDLVITHSPIDLNIDHSITAQATITALRPDPSLKCREILTMEIASSTDYGSNLKGESFLPDTFVDISSVYSVKEDALIAYEHEIRPYPHSRSTRGIEYRARIRGVEVGLEYAEAFRTHRRILGQEWPIS